MIFFLFFIACILILTTITKLYPALNQNNFTKKAHLKHVEGILLNPTARGFEPLPGHCKRIRSISGFVLISECIITEIKRFQIKVLKKVILKNIKKLCTFGSLTLNRFEIEIG